jgi:hypothetical protein
LEEDFHSEDGNQHILVLVRRDQLDLSDTVDVEWPMIPDSLCLFLVLLDQLDYRLAKALIFVEVDKQSILVMV